MRLTHDLGVGAADLDASVQAGCTRRVSKKERTDERQDTVYNLSPWRLLEESSPAEFMPAHKERGEQLETRNTLKSEDAYPCSGPRQYHVAQPCLSRHRSSKGPGERDSRSQASRTAGRWNRARCTPAQDRTKVRGRRGSP